MRGDEVITLADYRAVFLLPEGDGWTVFLATRGRTPRIAHERSMTDLASARAYAADLVATFGCRVLGATLAFQSEDAA